MLEGHRFRDEIDSELATLQIQRLNARQSLDTSIIDGTELRFLQIGIMLLGTMIDNLVVGGPAYNSRQLHHGDIILKVDGIPVTQNNIHDVMVGNDTPGSPIVVSVARGGPKVKLDWHH